jgi:uncharacterized protein
MIERGLKHLVKRLLSEYPALALVGARQSGKTTLARSFDGTYFDLEQDADRLRLDLKWKALTEDDRLIILDEAQSWPEIFPRLRGTIDSDRKRAGRFLLLGSVSPSLMVQVSESLAGRLSVLELTPFLLTELPDVPLEEVWHVGGFPDGGVLGSARYPRWQLDYLTLLAQRDLPNWGLPAKGRVTERLFRMVAAVHGQIWNATKIGQSLGLSYQTVNGYMDYLEGAFLVRRLQPYLVNLRKRLIRSPKVYWRDTGLLHALLQTADGNDLMNKPWVGASWEGFVIEQILSSLARSGRHGQGYFFRTSDRHEIDLVLDMGDRPWAIEIKLTANPISDDMKRLNKAADMIGAGYRILITQTSQCHAEGDRISCSLPWLLSRIEQMV